MNQDRLRPKDDHDEEERTRVDDLRGSPMAVGTLEEIIDDEHVIVSSSTSPEYYVSIMSFVDKDLLEPGCSVLLHHKTMAVVGVLSEDTDPSVNIMKLDKAPSESYADVGGLESQIQEIKELSNCRLLTLNCMKKWAFARPRVSFSMVCLVRVKRFWPKL